jgi:biofilm PGA synthesis N-glycosyltransferase PgaC
VASKELIVAPKAVAYSRVTELGPTSWEGSDQESLLIRAATRAGDVRRAMSRVMHDVRYRPPKRRTAKLLVLIPAHNEESSIGNVLTPC